MVVVNFSGQREDRRYGMWYLNKDIFSSWDATGHTFIYKDHFKK